MRRLPSGPSSAGAAEPENYVVGGYDADAESALKREAMAKDKQSIGGRYIDIFACSQNELKARLAGGPCAGLRFSWRLSCRASFRWRRMPT